MQYTTNYSLRKPQLIEPASVADLNANADSIDTLLYQNRHISATEYNQNTSYSVGDLVVYENLLYKCIGATSGNWDSTKWSRTTLAAEVELAGQSGGSQVEGNPSETATAQLEKIGIDNDIFFINDASKIIAEPYDSTATYAVGDYCIYGTLLYKCTTAVSTAEAFDSTKWTACLVTDEMGSGGGGSAELNEVTKAQYDALTEAQKKNGEMYFITDVNGDGSQFQPVIYSTDEREVGVWTDGKPLYQRTFIKDFTGSSTPQTLVDSDIDYAQQVAMAYRQISGSVIIYDSPFYLQSSTYVFCYIDVKNGKMLLYNTYNGSLRWIVTIRYTKLSDTVGSGTWTPQGVPAVHYSESEQVVGTWIDGKPLYEKTIDCGALPNSTSKTVAHNIANLKRVIGCTGSAMTATGLYIPLPYVQSSSALLGYQTNIYIDATLIHITTGDNVSAYTTSYITLRYTKTTD